MLVNRMVGKSTGKSIKEMKRYEKVLGKKKKHKGNKTDGEKIALKRVEEREACAERGCQWKRI